MKSKFTIFILVALLGVQELMSQTPEENQAMERFQEIIQGVNKAMSAKDYPRAMAGMDDFLTLINSRPQQLEDYFSVAYYQIACIKSLSGNLPEALAAFEKAVVDHG